MNRRWKKKRKRKTTKGMKGKKQERKERMNDNIPKGREREERSRGE